MKSLKNNISKKTIFYYSYIAFPLAMIVFPLYIYIPIYYEKSIGIDISLVGILIFIARLTDVFTDPYIGYISDKCIKYFDSRKPLMITGSFIIIYSFYQLLNPNIEYKEIYLLLYSILIYFGWSMINIPYLTWSCELSNNYHDKTNLNSYREIFTILGIIFALCIPYIYDISSQPKKSLNIIFNYFIFIFIPLLTLTMFKIKINNQKIENSILNIKTIITIYIKIKDLKYLHIGYFINNLANAIPATIFLLFIDLIIDKKDLSGLVLIIYFLSGIIALPFWNILSKKTGKKNCWLISIILASSAFIFVPFLDSNDIIAFIIISIISGFSLGIDMAIPTSIKSDIVQKYDKNISGLLFGIWSMITKFALAFAIFLSFVILGSFDFNSTSPSSKSLIVLSLLYGLVPVILKIVSIYFINKYKETI
jgi:Na+/melibiose symporter-like transporter